MLGGFLEGDDGISCYVLKTIIKHGKKFLELTKVEKTRHVLCLKEELLFLTDTI